jgi:hypothetical protein
VFKRGRRFFIFFKIVPFNVMNVLKISSKMFQRESEFGNFCPITLKKLMTTKKL